MIRHEVVFGGDTDALAFFDSIVTDEIRTVITAAITRGGRDVVAFVDSEQTVILDRAEVATDPNLPSYLRWLRSAKSGSWIVAQGADGKLLSVRLRCMSFAKGGVA